MRRSSVPRRSPPSGSIIYSSVPLLFRGKGYRSDTSSDRSVVRLAVLSVDEGDQPLPRRQEPGVRVADDGQERPLLHGDPVRIGGPGPYDEQQDRQPAAAGN